MIKYCRGDLDDLPFRVEFSAEPRDRTHTQILSGTGPFHTVSCNHRCFPSLSSVRGAASPSLIPLRVICVCRSETQLHTSHRSSMASSASCASSTFSSSAPPVLMWRLAPTLPGSGYSQARIPAAPPWRRRLNEDGPFPRPRAPRARESAHECEAEQQRRRRRV